MGNKHSAEICKDDYIVIEELEIGVNKTVRESTSEYNSESDIENDVFDYRTELVRELQNNNKMVKSEINRLNLDGYYNTIGNKDQRISFLEDKLHETEIEYNILYNEYMRLRIKMKKND
tara:strand:- start:1510 stop:1866 length:357 start_codon:yes stop_codon:yes gene_type:complete